MFIIFIILYIFGKYREKMNNVDNFEQVKSVVLEGYGTYDKIKVNISIYSNISINVVYKDLIKFSCCLK